MSHLFTSGQFQAQVMGEAKTRGGGEPKYLEGKSHLFDKLRTACQARLIYRGNRRQEFLSAKVGKAAFCRLGEDGYQNRLQLGAESSCVFIHLWTI